MTKRTELCRGQISQDIRKKYWMPLESSYKAGAWEALDAGYSESHRAYHTWEHIADLLEKLSTLSHLSARPDIITSSVFWHDAVYETQNRDGSPRQDSENVRDSAELFRRYSLLNPPDTGAVYDLIVATANHLEAHVEKGHYEGFAGDLDLFLDLDLSPLGAPWEVFVEDFARIRFEFAWVPEIVFYTKQLQILESFANEDVHLYRLAASREKWYPAARSNLTCCIGEMKKKIAELSLVRSKP